VRFLKISAVAALALAFMVTASFAGGAGCKTSTASASCTAKQAAACKGTMGNTMVEAMRLPSGGLVVHYSGANPEAVAYLHAKADGSPDKFCCGMTQKMASNDNCKVDITKVSNGVIVYVTSPKKEVVDAYEKEFATLTTPAPSR
jgi:hypothetical protein